MSREPANDANLTSCSRCGAALPAGTRAEDCPRCLLAAGLESGAGGAGTPPPVRTAPTPEEIAVHFPQLEVLELLGQGGMGIVYKARQRSLDRLVALKVMPPEAAREPGFVERFTREARTLARLQHANIVQVHDFGTSDGLCWLLMEYVDGANLRQAMREGHLTPAQALAIVPQVCDALQYAHEQGVVHRDVKPENILLDRAGRVRIADFGLAKIVQRTPVDVTLTRAGQVMGTLHYMAPEQYRTPDSVDHRADIYSLGVVFYEMLTGELPIGSFPPPSSKPGVDARIDGVVMRALERERDRRWQHASDVKTHVSEIATGPAAAGAAAGAGAATPPPPPAPAPGTKVVEVGGIKVTKGPEGSRVEVPGLSVDERGVRVGGVQVGGRVVTSRPSRLATAAGLGVPAAIVLGLGAWAVAAAAGESDAARAGWLVAMVVVSLGWIASIVAWARIRHSGGALTGSGWAATGTFLPLAFVCCGGPLAVWGVTEVPDGWGISVKEGDDGSSHVKMPFLEVEERADGSSRVRMPGLDVDSSGAKGTRVVVPGVVVVEDADGRVRVRISGPGVTPEDRGAAQHVTGGPKSLDGARRSELAATMRALWAAVGDEVVAREIGEIEGARANEFRFYHLALTDAGDAGRLVLTTPTHSLVLRVEREGELWGVAPGWIVLSGTAATEAERTRRLGDD